MDYINRQITKALKNADIVTRPNASPGFWVSFLLPASILTALVKSPEILTNEYKLATILATGLIISNVIFMTQCVRHHNFNITIAHYVSTVFTAFLFYTCLHRGIVFSVYSGFFATFSYYAGLPLLLKTLPSSFTFGEASIVTQGIILFVYASIVNLFKSTFIVPDRVTNISTVILQVGILGIALIVFLTYNNQSFRKPLKFYGLAISIITFWIIIPLHILLDRSPLVWIWHMLTDKVRTVSVMSFWVVCAAFAVIVINKQIYTGKRANTAARKAFHYLIVVVYLTGLIDQCSILYLASGIVLAIFFTLETLRLINLPPIGPYLQNGYTVFVDEKDAGALALTPIYLLVGCSLPLWLHPDSCDVTDSAGFNLLPMISGILIIGIGDTLASTVGSRFGKYKWAGNDKTIEGTAACMLGQSALVFLLMKSGYIWPDTTNMVKAGVAIFVSSLIEAKTDQIDNLILPLITYIILF